MSVYRLRFFFDYGSGVCFWAANEAARERFGYPVATAQLPVSAPLQNTLEDMITTYDESVDWNDPGGESRWDQAEWQRFDTSVAQVLAAVEADLGSAFEIVNEHHQNT